MANWPPDPNKPPENSSNPTPNNQHDPNHNLPAQYPVAQQMGGREWHLLEKTLMASIEEQRRARRWSIFFKLLTFGYLIMIFLIMGRGCTSAENEMTPFGADTPHIAVVDVQGVISADDEANARDVSAAIEEAYETENAKAVVLNINSPGGSPVQSDQIWQTLMDMRKAHPDKKSYAVIGDIGASGAYYIASGTDEIYVNPSSLVGSIGVIMPNYDIEGLMDKAGVEDRTFTAGEYKDILSMSRPMTEFEEQHVESVLNDTHQSFINAVQQGRGDRLKNPEANNIFTGLFWTGKQSIALGLADKSGSLETIEEELDLDNVVNYTPVDPVQDLFDRFAIKLGAGIGSAVDLPSLNESLSGENGEMR